MGRCGILELPSPEHESTQALAARPEPDVRVSPRRPRGPSRRGLRAGRAAARRRDRAACARRRGRAHPRLASASTAAEIDCDAPAARTRSARSARATRTSTVARGARRAASRVGERRRHQRRRAWRTARSALLLAAVRAAAVRLDRALPRGRLRRDAPGSTRPATSRASAWGMLGLRRPSVGKIATPRRRRSTWRSATAPAVRTSRASAHRWFDTPATGALAAVVRLPRRRDARRRCHAPSRGCRLCLSALGPHGFPGEHRARQRRRHRGPGRRAARGPHRRRRPRRLRERAAAASRTARVRRGRVDAPRGGNVAGGGAGDGRSVHRELDAAFRRGRPLASPV